MTTKVITPHMLLKNFPQYANAVTNQHDRIIIKRPENKNLILISEEEFNTWQETHYLLSEPTNRQALIESINQINSHHTKVLTPDEWDELYTTTI